MKVERFIREYANYKIRQYEELAKDYPEKRTYASAQIWLINHYVKLRKDGLISVDEVVECIRKA